MTKQDRDEYFKQYMKGKADCRYKISQQNEQQKIVQGIYHNIMDGNSFEDNRGDHK